MRSVHSFPLIMYVYSITVSKQTYLLEMTTAWRELNYCSLHIQWNANVISSSVSLYAHDSERFRRRTYDLFPLGLRFRFLDCMSVYHQDNKKRLPTFT